MTVADLSTLQKGIIRARYKKKRISIKLLKRALDEGLIEKVPDFDAQQLRYGDMIEIYREYHGKHVGQFLEYYQPDEFNGLGISYWWHDGFRYAKIEEVLGRA